MAPEELSRGGNTLVEVDTSEYGLHGRGHRKLLGDTGLDIDGEAAGGKSLELQQPGVDFGCGRKGGVDTPLATEG